jgi:hypothetical protein
MLIKDAPKRTKEEEFLPAGILRVLLNLEQYCYIGVAVSSLGIF